MKFNLKQNLLTLAMLSCVAGMIGCSSTAKSSTNTDPNKAIVSSEKPTSENTDKYPTSPTNRDTLPETKTSGGDKIGVAGCDDYIEKYEACVMGKVPEAARMTMQSSIEQMRQSWKQVAANPQAKAALAGGCNQARAASKQAMSAYACDW